MSFVVFDYFLLMFIKGADNSVIILRERRMVFTMKYIKLYWVKFYDTDSKKLMSSYDHVI